MIRCSSLSPHSPRAQLPTFRMPDAVASDIRNSGGSDYFAVQTRSLTSTVDLIQSCRFISAWMLSIDLTLSSGT